MKSDASLQHFQRILFLCIGAFIICAALAWSVSLYGFIRNALSAQGTVIALNAGGSHPQVRFTTQDGSIVDYPQDGLIFGYKVGDVTPVLYDPQRPDKAMINSFGAIWGFPLLALILGVAFIGMALLQKYRPALVS